MRKSILSMLILIPISSYAQITGYWQTDNGGCYQIRQDGNEIWWSGENPDSQRAKNIFHGYISGNIIVGIWCDLPSNRTQVCGESLSLRIENNNQLIKVSSSAPYSGTTWTRQSGPCKSTGEFWEVTGAGGWSAIWTRRVNSNVYDGLWTGPQGQKSTTVIEIEISGNNMKGTRTSSSDGTLCNYAGQLSSDGISVSGTASCTTGSPWNWSAVIRK